MLHFASFAVTSDVFYHPVLDDHCKSLTSRTHPFGTKIGLHPDALRKVAVPIRKHDDFVVFDAEILAPRLHDVGIIDSGACNDVGTGSLQVGVAGEKAGNVGRRADRRECARNANQDDRLSWKH